MNEFKEMKQSWYKRRTPTEKVPEMTDYSLVGFLKKDNHKCTMTATFDDGNTYEMDAVVHSNEIYTVDGGSEITHWSVQGITPYGISVILKLKE